MCSVKCAVVVLVKTFCMGLPCAAHDRDIQLSAQHFVSVTRATRLLRTRSSEKSYLEDLSAL